MYRQVFLQQHCGEANKYPVLVECNVCTRATALIFSYVLSVLLWADQLSSFSVAVIRPRCTVEPWPSSIIFTFMVDPRDPNPSASGNGGFFSRECQIYKVTVGYCRYYRSRIGRPAGRQGESLSCLNITVGTV